MSATKECIIALTSKNPEPLDADKFRLAFDELMDGKATPAQIGCLLTALTLDKATPEIVAACARSMRSHALACEAPNVVDIVGTGGDGIDTFNVSTAAGFIVAACGGRVMKHGNRSNSSKCGSADLLEALGARIDVNGDQAIRVLDRAGYCFLFAQKFHPAMRFVGPARKQMGIRTIFNILGPLTNPCVPVWQLSGVFDKSLGMLYAKTFVELGIKRGMICHSFEGLDEISCGKPTLCWIVTDGKIEERTISPEADFGLPSHPLSDVVGGYPDFNVNLLHNVLDGKENGAYTDFLLENAAAALWVMGIATDFKHGVALGREAITSGKARAVVDAYAKATNDVIAEDEKAAKENQSILTKIATRRQELIAAEEKKVPIDVLYRTSLANPPAAALNVVERITQEPNSAARIALMAEIKRASPSKGLINGNVDPATMALAYAKGGASVISVLTEPEWFKGSIDDLKAVVAALKDVDNRPAVLLKDFVESEYQLVQARAAGADTALLIVARLAAPRLTELMACSRQLGMEPLVEVATEEEMKIALSCDAKFIGVNNRDLHTFTVDMSKTARLMQLIPDSKAHNVKVAALSGIKTRDDVDGMEKCNAAAILVGETLMRAPNAVAAIETLLGVSPSKKQKT